MCQLKEYPEFNLPDIRPNENVNGVTTPPRFHRVQQELQEIQEAREIEEITNSLGNFVGNIRNDLLESGFLDPFPDQPRVPRITSQTRTITHEDGTVATVTQTIFIPRNSVTNQNEPL